MFSSKIFFPIKLTTQTALKFGRDLRQLPESDLFEIDFSRCKWIEPFSALIASSEIVRHKYRNYGKPIKVVGHDHMTYAARMGFFKSIGFNFGSAQPQVIAGIAYQPIQILTSSEIQNAAELQCVPIGEVLEQHADRLAEMLCQSSNCNVHETLTYSMREVMRNVLEHSGANRIGFCAQFWPSKQMVEVAVMDWGIGIRNGLTQNPKLNPVSDADALQLALLPGVSGKGEQVKRLKKKTIWTNSGFGLYMTSRLCRSGGTFLIGSGDAGLLLSGVSVLPLGWGILGTSIRLQMNIKNLGLLNVDLERFRKEAHAFRRESSEIDYLTASMASRALSKDLA